MRVSSLRTIALSLLVVAAGCGQDATAPAASSLKAMASLLGSPATVAVITRNVPLAAPISASATIGALGGVINLPGAGLKVVVPALAVTSPTRLTVTALAGSQVAYEFEPHGTRFLVPLIATQNLVGTSALNGGLLPAPLFTGYFSSVSDLNPLNGTGLVSELLGTSVSLLTKTAVFPIPHFSGWLIATGKGQSTTSEESASQ
jgi:hypothetical protein